MAAAPQPFLDLTCADLVPATIANTATDAAITAQAIARYRELSWFDQPRGAAVRQVGGFTCEWSNGVVESDDNESPDYAGIYVSVLPDATDEWPKFDAYTGGELSAASCGSGAYAQSCTANALDGANWLLVEVRGARAADPLGALNAVLASVREAIAGGTAVAPWTPPPGTLALDLSCDGPQPVIDGYFGRSNSAYNDGGGWSQVASSWSRAGLINAYYCPYVYETANYLGSSVSIEYVAGADWARHEAISSGLLPSGSTFTTGSMNADDSGWLSCTSDSSCTMHLGVARGWVRVQVLLEPEDSGVDTASMLTDLAEAIVAQVRS
jgi:hypothetical protein